MQRSTPTPSVRSFRLSLELLGLYGLGPVAVYQIIYREHVPVLILMPVVMALVLLVLIVQGGVGNGIKTLLQAPRARDLFNIVALFLAGGSALVLFTYLTLPQLFLSFPRTNQKLWLLVMIFYPLISVTSQELFYRVLYFERYASLFGKQRVLPIVVNAAFFAFMHAVIFSYHRDVFHWQAIAISFIGGLIFAYRYQQTRSFLAVAFEHALYGDLVFTIGLGAFFFTGVANL